MICSNILTARADKLTVYMNVVCDYGCLPPPIAPVRSQPIMFTGVCGLIPQENPCQHPVFFLKDTSAEDLRAVIEFVYNGEVNVSQSQLASFIKTAEMLQIRGLSGEEDRVS